MIPVTVHTRFELKACMEKLGKLCDVGLGIDNEHRAWAFDAIKQTQAEIDQLKIKLNELGAPFTALKYAPSKRI